MKAIVLAYHNIGCRGIEALRKHGFEIQAVFTHADDPQENTWFESVAELSARLGLPVFAPEDINHPLWVKRIAALQPDIIFSFYYRHLVSAEILRLLELARGKSELIGVTNTPDSPLAVESAQAAVSLVKAGAAELGIDPAVFERSDLHIHVPAGAIPKDGPSAGTAIYLSLVSLLTGRPIRHDIAMTGEISLRGLVLLGGGRRGVLLARDVPAGDPQPGEARADTS